MSRPLGISPIIENIQRRVESSPASIFQGGTQLKTDINPQRNAKPLPDSYLAPVAITRKVLSTKAQPNFYRLSNLDAELILPPGVNSTFEAYAQRLTASGIFEDTQSIAQVELQPGTMDENKPKIGILISEPIALLGARTIKKIIAEVRDMGCTPVLIPPCADIVLPSNAASRKLAMESIAQQLDGVIGPGGADVDPEIYGEENTYSKGINLKRDIFERDMVLTLMDSPVYMFGICRSHQLWNAIRGGSLVQDIQNEGYSSIPQHQKDANIPYSEPYVLRDDDGKTLYENWVYLKGDSKLSSAVANSTKLLTNSLHHQAVRTVGKGLRAVAVALDPKFDKETIEATEGWNILTTQWHPELMAKKSSTQKNLLASVGRRAKIFNILRNLSPTENIIDAMAKSPENFESSDFAWATSELLPRLGLFQPTPKSWR